MTQERITEYFRGVVTKRLSAVEAEPTRSNQHEFNGIQKLRELFGEDKQTLPATFLWLDDTHEPLSSDGFVTWYDARERHETRTEYRLYFPTTDVSQQAEEGDLIFIAVRENGRVLVVYTRSGSTLEHQLRWLFALPEALDAGIESAEGTRPINYAATVILEALGVEIQEPNDRLDEMLRLFGRQFPPTRVFSQFARSGFSGLSACDDPDGAIVAWMASEERLFRTLERSIVAARIEQGFGRDVDEFVRYSLSVQNRRKARAGLALENHLRHLLDTCGVAYSKNPITEHNSRPDFIFPGIDQYHDAKFPVDRLTMLAAKSSLKERWRQILAEAARVPNKHLFTLIPGISQNQTDEMRANLVTLVVPTQIQSTYNAVQRPALVSLRQFVELVKTRQN